MLSVYYLLIIIVPNKCFDLAVHVMVPYVQYIVLNWLVCVLYDDRSDKGKTPGQTTTLSNHILTFYICFLDDIIHGMPMYNGMNE